MIDQYKRHVNKLKLELSNASKLSYDELKFIISNIIQLDINSVDIQVPDNTDYEKLVEIVSFISNDCNIYDIGITSECIGIQKHIQKLKNVGLKNINICIDSLKQYKYKTIHGGANINDIINTINICIKLNIKTVLKCIVVNGFNSDEINDYISMTKSLPLDVCFSEILPIPNESQSFHDSYINIKDFLEKNSNLCKLDVKNNSMYKLINSIGNIYVETHNDSSNCKYCNEIILTDNGFIKSCIHKETGFDVRQYIYKPMMFKESIKEIMYLKEKNNIEGGAYYG